LAFQDHDAALIHALNPLWNGAGSDLTNYEKTRGATDRARESDGGEDLRPRPRIVAGNVVVESGALKRSGLQGSRESERSESKDRLLTRAAQNRTVTVRERNVNV
jgi:hypothetical protein